MPSLAALIPARFARVCAAEGHGVLLLDMTNGEPIYPRWLFYYYATHLRWVPKPSFLIDISAHLETKLRAIRAYETQFVRANAHVVDWIEQGSRYFGSRMGADAAEPFFTKEPLGLAGLTGVAL